MKSFYVDSKTTGYPKLLDSFLKSGVSFDGNTINMKVVITVFSGSTDRNSSEKLNFYISKTSSSLTNVGSFELKNHKKRTGVYLLDFQFTALQNSVYNDIVAYVVEDGKKIKTSFYTNSVSQIDSNNTSGEIKISASNVSIGINLTAIVTAIKKES